MTSHESDIGAHHGAPARARAVVVLVALLLAGLPFAVWLDLKAISESALTRQVTDFDAVISGIREFYASDVVGRVLAAHDRAIPTAHYQSTDGGIPIPATFSLELGRVVGTNQGNIQYRFISDYPFRGRAPHQFDAFERNALHVLRENPQQTLTWAHTDGLTTEVRLVAPVIMQQSCVACHNADPDSPKHDWRVGDVRGIQELMVVSPIATNVLSFRFLLVYFVIALALGVGFIVLQHRQAAAIERANAFLASISERLSRYLSPQIYRSIFSGQKDTKIYTERKRLTVFFSDIKDFTSTSERLQPEELTRLLNEYFTAMSEIALAYGGTIDKFVGDAMLVFFGDPETKGAQEDAAAAVAMAIAMQARLTVLGERWRSEGIEQPFRARMGINTGYVNVGNFGSADRMDYTIIGAEVNLSARLEAMAEPGTVVMSYETYALVRDRVDAEPLAAIRVKGIAREVVPYRLVGWKRTTETEPVVQEHVPGLDLFIDRRKLRGSEQAREALRKALALLDGEATGSDA